MTLSLLFSHTFGDADGSERVQRFHRRLTEDTVAPDARAHSPSADMIDGVPVAELLARLRADDRTALATIYNALFQPLWRVAVLQTHSREAAEDLVQDVFLWFWTHRAAIAPNTDVRVYLSSAVRNRARNLGRHGRVVDTAGSGAMVEREVSGIGMGPAAPDSPVEREDFLAAYQRALTLLTERELTAALLRWEEHFTLEQIAQVLSVSPRGALGVVARAQQKVQDALKDFR